MSCQQGPFKNGRKTSWGHGAQWFQMAKSARNRFISVCLMWFHDFFQSILFAFPFPVNGWTSHSKFVKLLQAISVNFTDFFLLSFWRVFVILPNSVVSTLTSNSCWYMFFFVLGSLTPLSLILLANSVTGNRESIPRQYSSNVSNTNLYWFCKELWHFLAIFGYILNMMLQFNNFLSRFDKQTLSKSCETGTFENRELIPR